MKKRPLSKKLRILRCKEDRQLERTIKALQDEGPPDLLRQELEKAVSITISQQIQRERKMGYVGVDLGYGSAPAMLTYGHQENGMLVIDDIVVQGHQRLKALGRIT